MLKSIGRYFTPLWLFVNVPSPSKQDVFNRAFERVIAGEIGPTDLRRELGLTHATYYRYRKNYFEKNPQILKSGK